MLRGPSVAEAAEGAFAEGSGAPGAGKGRARGTGPGPAPSQAAAVAAGSLGTEEPGKQVRGTNFSDRHAPWPGAGASGSWFCARQFRPGPGSGLRSSVPHSPRPAGAWIPGSLYQSIELELKMLLCPRVTIQETKFLELGVMPLDPLAVLGNLDAAYIVREFIFPLGLRLNVALAELSLST